MWNLCQEEKQTITHLMYRCRYTQNLLQDLKAKMTECKIECAYQSTQLS